MYTIATLTQLRQQLGLASTDTSDDARLLAALQAAAEQVERRLGRRFCPRVATLPHDVDYRDTQVLTLSDDLLALTALTDGDGVSIALGEVVLRPYGDPPYSLLHLRPRRPFVAGDTPVVVTGWWGWHDDWARAFRGSADSVQDNPLAAGASTLTVANAGGADSAGQSPRLHVGHLLRIESEYLRVLAITGNVLTVARGVQGTTAAEHAQGTPIETFQPAPDALLMALRWAAALYRAPDDGGAALDGLTRALDLLARIEF